MSEIRHRTRTHQHRNRNTAVYTVPVLYPKCFRYHPTFIFVALNIYQRRIAHLHTSFTTKRSNFNEVAKHLATLTPEILSSVANHLEYEGKLSDLQPSQINALELLQKVNTISANIAGSEASKILARNKLRSYSGFFGLPHLYLTLNPCAEHSPIFQAIFGDNMVDLNLCYPKIVDTMERSLRLAKDPVAASDFFEFSIRAIFEHLFAWDFTKCQSKPTGGILGHLKAWTGTVELTERGSFHGHFLIWLLGGMNPSELHARLHQNIQFEKRFFSIFDNITCHSFPDVDYIIDKF